LLKKNYLNFFLFPSFLLGFCFFNSNFSRSETNIVKTYFEAKYPIPLKSKDDFLLIGLEPYLGNYKKQLILKSPGLITLKDSSGIIHKSSNIKIIWLDVPIENSFNVKRKVAGPFSSFESARQFQLNLQKIEIDSFIARPKDWEVWIPINQTVPNQKEFNVFAKKISYLSSPYLVNRKKVIKLSGPINFEAKSGLAWKDGIYNGVFLLKRDSYGSWTFIEKIQMPRYLEGVVPHEIGSNSPSNALAAQTILARTWAIANQSRFKIDGYHLCDSVQCQVYKRKYPPSTSIKSAIKQTKGIVIKWRGEPINAVYHATNGGVSASIAEAWEVDPQPYLLTKLDGNSKWRKSHQVPLLTPQKVQNILMDNDGAYGKNHYLFRWNKNITEEELKSYFQLAQKDIKFPVKIKIEERGKSGRVVKLKIISLIDKKILILEKGEIRKILKKLPSTLFIIKNSSPKNWEFYGGGFGHGVGMSQAGAIEMAENGWSVNQILNHYYPGTEIDSLP